VIGLDDNIRKDGAIDRIDIGGWSNDNIFWDESAIQAAVQQFHEFRLFHVFAGFQGLDGRVNVALAEFRALAGQFVATSDSRTQFVEALASVDSKFNVVGQLLLDASGWDQFVGDIVHVVVQWHWWNNVAELFLQLVSVGGGGQAADQLLMPVVVVHVPIAHHFLDDRLVGALQESGVFLDRFQATECLRVRVSQA